MSDRPFCKNPLTLFLLKKTVLPPPTSASPRHFRPPVGILRRLLGRLPCRCSVATASTPLLRRRFSTSPKIHGGGNQDERIPFPAKHLSWPPPPPSPAPRSTQLAAADLLPLGHAAASLFLLKRFMVQGRDPKLKRRRDGGGGRGSRGGADRGADRAGAGAAARTRGKGQRGAGGAGEVMLKLVQARAIAVTGQPAGATADLARQGPHGRRQPLEAAAPLAGPPRSPPAQPRRPSST
jgi:hypothetical protein